MNEALKNNNIDELTLTQLIKILWEKKYVIIIITSLFAIFSVFYALSLPNVYTSKAILAPVDENESLYSNSRSINALSTLSGIGLPGATSVKTQEAIARIKSYEFFTKYFLSNIQIHNMTAVKRWDPSKGGIIYDSSIYNAETKSWVKEKNKPSSQKAYISYKSMLKVTQDNKSGFITLSIKHKSPEIAKKWLDLIILNINESMREINKTNSKNAITFLNESFSSTNIQSLRDASSRLLEDQMKLLMLASSNKEFVLKVLDAPIAPEIKSEPKRAIICIFITFFGAALSIIISIFMYRNENQTRHDN